MCLYCLLLHNIFVCKSTAMNRMTKMGVSFCYFCNCYCSIRLCTFVNISFPSIKRQLEAIKIFMLKSIILIVIERQYIVVHLSQVKIVLLVRNLFLCFVYSLSNLKIVIVYHNCNFSCWKTKT